MRRIGLALALVLFAGCSSDNQSDAGGLPKQDGGIVVGDAAPDAELDAATDDAAPFEGPTKLSETGLYADFAARTLAPGVREFDVRYPLWSDDATKKRFLQLPGGQQIDTSSMDVWTFPIGTKAWKEFAKDGKVIETRLLMKKAEGADGWLKVAYLWNEDGSDAVAVPGGVDDALGTSHDVPDIEGCEQCHNGVGDVLIGVSAIQLSRETGGGYLSTLIADGVLTTPPAAEFAVPGDGVVEDTIGYLHGNCGSCHNNEHFLASKRTLRLKLLVSATTPEATGLYKTAINADASHDLGGTSLIVIPGNPELSQLSYRMGIRDLSQMPPIGTEQVDALSLEMVKSWILGLSP